MHRRCIGILPCVHQRDFYFLQKSHDVRFRTTGRMSKSKMSTFSTRQACSIQFKSTTPINSLFQLQTLRCMGTAYSFHPQTFVLEPEKQTTFLTKALMKPDLPKCFQSDLEFSPDYLESIMNDFEQSIIQTMLFCHDGEMFPKKPQKKNTKKQPKQVAAARRKRRRPTGLPLKLFLNFIQIAATRSDDRYPISLNSSIAHEPYVSASWQRNDMSIQTSGKFGHVMMSNKPLEVFATDQDLLQSEKDDIKWDDVIKPVFHMIDTNNTNLRTINSFHDGAPYQHPHTLFYVHNRHRKPRELLGHGIMYSFAHAYSTALSNPNNSIGMDTIEPVPIQCIITDGRTMSFICYQLNTLNLNNDSGMKNFTWIAPELTMFDEVTFDTSESNEADITLHGFNKQCFELFLKFVLNY